MRALVAPLILMMLTGAWVQGAVAAVCPPSVELTCDVGGGAATASGTTVGAVDTWSRHSTCVGWDESGPDAALRWTPEVDDEIVLRFGATTPPALDLFLLEGDCEAQTCLAFGDATLRYEVEAGVPLRVVVDGYGGASGSYDLELYCRSTYVPACAGRECGPDGGPFGDSCGSCPPERPQCDLTTGRCVTDGCYGIPAAGCCDGTTLRYCRENRVVVEDCPSVTPDRPTCGYWEGLAAGLEGYYCGYEGEGGGLPRACTCSPDAPACEPSWECGVSACGEPCGDCAPGEVCEAHVCAAAPACVPDTTLVCEDGLATVHGSTGGGAAALSAYGDCDAATWPGPERAHRFVAPSAGGYRAWIETDALAGLRLFLLRGQCDERACVAAGDRVSWAAAAGEELFLVVDGAESAAFSLYVDCTCQPECATSLACGDDGCGGSCGTCAEDFRCEADGVCHPDPGLYCAAVGAAGCCDGGEVFWCEDGLLRAVDCGANPGSTGSCGWFADGGYYECGRTGGDPSGEHPRDCPWEPSTCVPSCDARACGADDGCGGRCDGPCPEGLECRGAECVPRAAPDVVQDAGGQLDVVHVDAPDDRDLDEVPGEDTGAPSDGDATVARDVSEGGDVGVGRETAGGGCQGGATPPRPLPFVVLMVGVWSALALTRRRESPGRRAARPRV